MVIKYSETESKNVTLREGFAMISSACLNSLELDYESFTADQNDIKFLHENVIKGGAKFLIETLSTLKEVREQVKNLD